MLWVICLMLLVFAPLLVTDIRAPVSTSISAVDASPWACASVAAELSERAVRELWRFRDRRGGYVRCETDFEAFVRDVLASDDAEAHRAVEAAFADEGEVAPDLTEHERQFSWVSELADAVGWRPSFKYRARISEHINLKEGRAYRTLVRRTAFNAEAHGTRQLVLGDSAVVRGAAAKGRSSTRRLWVTTGSCFPSSTLASSSCSMPATPGKIRSGIRSSLWSVG